MILEYLNNTCFYKNIIKNIERCLGSGCAYLFCDQNLTPQKKIRNAQQDIVDIKM